MSATPQQTTHLAVSKEMLARVFEGWHSEWQANPDQFMDQEAHMKSPDGAALGAEYVFSELEKASGGNANAIILRPPTPYAGLSPGYSAGSNYGMTRQGYWCRMRDQRPGCWLLEPLRYFLKVSMYDAQGRLWQCAMPAVMDDFGNLVEVAG